MNKERSAYKRQEKIRSDGLTVAREYLLDILFKHQCGGLYAYHKSISVLDEAVTQSPIVAEKPVKVLLTAVRRDASNVYTSHCR